MCVFYWESKSHIYRQKLGYKDRMVILTIVAWVPRSFTNKHIIYNSKMLKNIFFEKNKFQKTEKVKFWKNKILKSKNSKKKILKILKNKSILSSY